MTGRLLNVILFMVAGSIAVLFIVQIVYGQPQQQPPQSEIAPASDPYFLSPEGQKKVVEDCLVSLKAQNPRPQHLLDCDVAIPLVPINIIGMSIENDTDIRKKVNEYVTQRGLDIDEESYKRVWEQYH